MPKSYKLAKDLIVIIIEAYKIKGSNNSDIDRREIILLDLV
jgi:hypothetical protein